MASGKIVPLNDLSNGKSPLPQEPHTIVNRRLLWTAAHRGGLPWQIESTSTNQLRAVHTKHRQSESMKFPT
jgi:hypothetical protein